MGTERLPWHADSARLGLDVAAKLRIVRFNDSYFLEDIFMKLTKLKSALPFTLALICTVNIAPLLAEEVAEEELEQAAEKYNQKEDNERYKVVCKKEVQVGSRIKKEVCRTQATMERQSDEASRSMDRVRTSVGVQE